ncbi:MAG: biotin--[acetyl-CoA-carboxylase] ligase [Gammaproteobacteria bacterium]|nr:biotin--[acetyl-CoA-carboxylase] ligase [Gammaproteobacteria bacterium]
MTLSPTAAVATIREAAGESPLGTLEVFAQIDSTNSWLLARPAPPPGQLDACLAYAQTAGRGRHGRVWSAPAGAGLSLSMAWTFSRRPATLPALALAAGVAVRRALADLDITGVSLKWPNDLVAADGKLGGILAELRGERGGQPSVVIGVGINVALPDAARAAIVQSWGRGPVDLLTLTGRTPALEPLAGRVLARAAEMLAVFGAQGFSAFRDEFAAADYLFGRTLTCPGPAATLSGEGAGIDPDGALRLSCAGEIQRVVSGEVSVRLES